MNLRTQVLQGLWLVSFALCSGPAPGEECEATGDGFTRQDPCRYTCVEWEVDCPDGSTATPEVCSAGACSSDGDCGPGGFCAQINMTDWECLPVSVCGE